MKKAMTAGDHRERCRHRLRLQYPLPLSLIPLCSSRPQWICNDCAGFWIGDGGRQVCKTAERSGSLNNGRMRSWIQRDTLSLSVKFRWVLLGNDCVYPA